jgi:hypothetical protein
MAPNVIGSRHLLGLGTTPAADTRRALMPPEKADISRLVATGWEFPIPITVEARDGSTDLYGLPYRTSVDTQNRPLMDI